MTKLAACALSLCQRRLTRPLSCRALAPICERTRLTSSMKAWTLAGASLPKASFESLSEELTMTPSADARDFGEILRA